MTKGKLWREGLWGLPVIHFAALEKAINLIMQKLLHKPLHSSLLPTSLLRDLICPRWQRTELKPSLVIDPEFKEKIPKSTHLTVFPVMSLINSVTIEMFLSHPQHPCLCNTPSRPWSSSVITVLFLSCQQFHCQQNLPPGHFRHLSNTKPLSLVLS